MSKRHENLTRREMMGKTLLGAGAFATAPFWTEGISAAEIQELAAKGVDKVKLGKTGITLSRLAQGTGMHGYRRSSDHTRMGQEKLTELVQRGLDRGINFFDMADLYGTHPYVRKALKAVPREKLVFMSKIWTRKEDWNNASGGALKEVDRFRKELDTDMIDIVLLHCMGNGKWADQHKRVMDELSELKERKIVRAVGISSHSIDALRVASAHPWIDVILARINHKGVKMDGPVDDVVKVLKTAKKNDKAILGMKIFGEGLLKTPQEKDASLKFVLENNLVDAMTIGMLKPEEVDDSVARLNKALASIA